MFQVTDSMPVNAPLDRCFMLATNVDLVRKTIGMRPVEGVTSGCVVGGSRLLWRGWKFGLPALHETLITEYERPRCFQDTQGQGRFRFFQHDHEFVSVDGQTMMRDAVRFELPFGWVGRLVGRLVLVPHVRGLVRRRFLLLKGIAEGPDWEQWVCKT